MNVGKVYRQDGCVLIKKFYTEEELRTLSSIIERVHSLWMHKNFEKVVQSKLNHSRSVTYPEFFQDKYKEERLELFEFMSSDRLVDLLAELLDPPFFFGDTQIFFNSPNFTKEGYWHRDFQSSNLPEDLQRKMMETQPILHIHIPFLKDDLFEFVPGSHVRWDNPEEREIRLGLGSRRRSESMPNAKVYPAEVGDIVVFSVHGIHRGRKYAPEPVRRTFDILYASKFEGSASLIDSKCLPDDQEMTRIKNKFVYHPC